MKIHRTAGAFLGTLVEYYDYSLYAFSATLIAQSFFSRELTAFEQIKSVFEVYAIGYLAKPIGALIFGFLGDIYGRKKALSFSILGIALPTAFIGILPEYKSWGIYSSFLLLACRLLQSIFTAGEYDGAALYVIEHFGKKHRYLASALTRCSGAFGLLMGVSISYLFSLQTMNPWAWRIPFLISLPLAIAVFILRRHFQETPDFQARKPNNLHQDSHLKLRNAFAWMIQEKAFILKMIFLAGGFGVTYQIALIFMKPYLSLLFPQEKALISFFSFISVACFAVSMPIFGYFADRIGIRKMFLYSALGFWTAALFLAINLYVQFLPGVFLGMILIAVGASPFNSLTHGFVFDALTAEKRYRSIGIGHTLGSMFMSGSAAWICSVGMTYWSLFPIAYMVFFSVIFLYVTIIFSKQKKSFTIA